MNTLSSPFVWLPALLIVAVIIHVWVAEGRVDRAMRKRHDRYRESSRKWRKR